MAISSRHLFLGCFTIRLIYASIARTAFAPDEFWQGPEVAHQMVFGYGHLTWEWAAGLRSYLHPSIYALFYWALKVLRKDYSLLVAKGPQLVQALFAALADLYVYKLALNLFGPVVARWTIISTSRSSRSNITTRATGKEGSITPSSYYLRSTKWISIAALCVAIRPSSALFWGATSLWYLASWCPGEQRLNKAILGISIGLFVLFVTALLDRVWYQRWVLVPWNFFAFNLLHGGSELYGAHPWHWNLSCGVPTVLTTLLPLVLIGVYRARECSPQEFLLAKLVCIQLLAYSLPAHKEFRFLLPALQLAMPYCGLAAASLIEEGQRKKKGSVAAASFIPSSTVRRRFAIAMLGLQVPVTLAFSLYHQRAQVQVMSYLQTSQSTSTSVLFLTPCHTTPYYSYIHKAIPMRFLDCSPPGWADAVHQLNKDGTDWLQLPKFTRIADVQSTLSQRQQFESNPSGYIKMVFKLNSKIEWPQVIVGFGGTMDELDAVLKQYGYREKRRLWNCLVPVDSKNECSVSVYERQTAKNYFS
ncbi:hypothetical protein Ndes2437A_g06266 [Nannochloris sp. 'desiccata']